MSQATAAKARVYWVTGLSGAGKTTLAQALHAQLSAGGAPVVLLDGDRLRGVFGDDLGYGLEDRRRSAMRNARLCALLSEQGVTVVCATISMFDACRAWAREHVPGYREIYLEAPIALLRTRDTRGIYDGSRGAAVGEGVTAELPRTPDLRIEQDFAVPPGELARRVVAACV